MKAAFRTMLGLAVVLAVVVMVQAQDKKSKTLKGELGCGKCVFKLSKDIHKGKCINAIKVKEGDKDVIYILDDKGRGEKYHAKICTDSAKGSVTGAVSKKGKLNYIKPAKDGVKYDD